MALALSPARAFASGSLADSLAPWVGAYEDLGPEGRVAAAALVAIFGLLVAGWWVRRREIGRRTRALEAEIRERRQAEASSRASERRLRSLIETAPLCIQEIDLRGHVLTTNARGLAMHGAARAEDLRDRPFLSLVASDDRELVAGMLSRALGGEPREFEFIGAGREPLMQSAALIPIFDADGLVSELMAITQDITERRRWEDRLRASASEIERHGWMSRGLASLRAQLRGEQDYAEMGEKVLRSLGEHLGTHVAALYLRERATLKLAASRAFHAPQGISGEIAVGEGLVGQVAADGRTLVLNDVPEGYLSVRSGLGEAPARQLVFVPITTDGDVTGVLEVASLQTMSDHEIEFLEAACIDVGFAVTAIASRRRVAALLDQTQLQAQELLAQQRELQETNAELQEQAILMEEQREALAANNTALEMARLDLVAKAKALEEASKYKSEFFASMSHEIRT
ncbi:MAG: GAF domain-containing protein, partial [Myxococcales bacterium]|nr:GAF domain-containing protein [Myxococcales bacterium]